MLLQPTSNMAQISIDTHTHIGLSDNPEIFETGMFADFIISPNRLMGRYVIYLKILTHRVKRIYDIVKSQIVRYDESSTIFAIVLKLRAVPIFCAGNFNLDVPMPES